MSLQVSIVIPTLADRELLNVCLAALFVEVQARAAGDEIVVVDDSGNAQLEAWIRESYPTVVYIANKRNLGFAQSLLVGVHQAASALVFAQNPDVIVRAGFLSPLVETLGLPNVHAVSPYVLLNGDVLSDESLPELIFDGGIPRVRRKSVELTPGKVCSAYPEGIPVAFALGGAFLFRRADFIEAPFDCRFEPFYWEDVDWCQSALSEGKRILVDPRSVVEHHHRGTISARVPQALVRAAIEKNRLLFSWKHGAEEFHALEERLIDHAIGEDREELIWLALALAEAAKTPLPGKDAVEPV
ncbi:MAG: GT2 family glycosyltransferase [Planctomycetota bacterium]|jgi:GT2 family glycosyltransferase